MRWDNIHELSHWRLKNKNVVFFFKLCCDWNKTHLHLIANLLLIIVASKVSRKKKATTKYAPHGIMKWWHPSVFKETINSFHCVLDSALTKFGGKPRNVRLAIQTSLKLIIVCNPSTTSSFSLDTGDNFKMKSPSQKPTHPNKRVLNYS